MLLFQQSKEEKCQGECCAVYVTGCDFLWYSTDNEAIWISPQSIPKHSLGLESVSVLLLLL